MQIRIANYLSQIFQFCVNYESVVGDGILLSG
jgi:hypothetical protein